MHSQSDYGGGQRSEHIYLEAGANPCHAGQVGQSCDRRALGEGEGLRGGGSGVWGEMPNQGPGSHSVNTGNHRQGTSPDGQKDYSSESQVRRTPETSRDFKPGITMMLLMGGLSESCFLGFVLFCFCF